MTEFPVTGMDETGRPMYDTRVLAIAWENGSLEQREELPQQAQFALSFQNPDAELTLLHTNLQLGNALFNDAFSFQYDFGTAGMQQTGLTLRYFTGLQRTELRFTEQFYRWNHPMEIPVTIPE